MKKIILLITFIGCSLISDTSTETLIFTPNTEPDMSHYNLYLWVGTDTSQCTFFDAMPINQIHEDFYSQIQYTLMLNEINFQVESDGYNYFAVVLQAVDSSGLHSPGGFAKVEDTNSNFMLTKDKTAPSKPLFLIIKETK